MASQVVPEALAQAFVDQKNSTICEGVYNYFASVYGTKPLPAAAPHQPQAATVRSHNGELKGLKKAKTQAQLVYRREKCTDQDKETIQTLRREHLRATRAHNRALKKKKKAKLTIKAYAMRRECSKSFWRFASKILDQDSVSNVQPSFNAETAETFFRKSTNQTIISFPTLSDYHQAFHHPSLSTMSQLHQKI